MSDYAELTRRARELLAGAQPAPWQFVPVGNAPEGGSPAYPPSIEDADNSTIAWLEQADGAGALIAAAPTLIAQLVEALTGMQQECYEVQLRAARAIVQRDEAVNAIAEKFSDPTITGMSIQQGAVDMGLKGGTAEALAHAFAAQFRESGAVNYLEMTFTASDGLRLAVTLQRCGGITPGAAAAQAERERDEALAAVGRAEIRAQDANALADEIGRALPALEAENARLRSALEAAGVPRMGVDLIALEPAKAATEPHADRSTPALEPLESRAGPTGEPIPLARAHERTDLAALYLERALADPSLAERPDAEAIRRDLAGRALRRAYYRGAADALTTRREPQPAGWPEPITDRLPTAEDADEYGCVLAYHDGNADGEPPGWYQNICDDVMPGQPWLSHPPAPGEEGGGRG